MQSLHHLSLQQLVMTPDAFLAQVPWPRVKLPSIRGGDTSSVADDDATDGEANDDYIQTSVMLIELGIQGPHRIEAYFDQEFFLFFIFYFYLF